MLRDGTLPAVAPARVRPELFGPPAPRPVPAVVLPRRFGWIQRMMPEWQAHWINHWRLQLEEFLTDPELLAMLAAAPQTRRVLRPICAPGLGWRCCSSAMTCRWCGICVTGWR